MAHPMIADEVLRILTAAGLTRSDTTRKLIACQNEIPPYLKQIIKQLLTKRESKVNKESGEIKQDTFSKLIQDVHEKESKSMCVRLFKDAADKFTQVPVFPQALARFYYIILTDYVNATYWAKEAIKRDQKNSFFRDTLGQVYKNQLKKEIATSARDILRIGKLALEAFEDEIKIAEQEQEPGMQEDKVINTSTIFNNRGLFGYIEVADIIFNKLTCVNTEWANILTQETQTHSLIHPQMSEEHKSLLMTLRQRLEVRFEFFQTYLTYSVQAINKKDPSYIWPSIKECYQKFRKKECQTAWQILQEGMATTFAGLLSTLEDKSFSELELITEQWRKMYEDDADADAAQNYILAKIILSQTSSASTVPIKELQEILLQFWEKQKYDSSPEFYLLAILLFWPDGAQPPGNPNAPDLKKCVQDMRHSYKRTYQKHLRSRYLVPLFFFGKEGLQRLVYRSRLNQTDLNWLTNGDESVEIEGLQRIRGEVRNHMIFVLRENNEMEVSAHNPASVYKSGLVSFYLGFTIRGPVAFNIRYVVSAVGFVDR
ncbi:sterile alpha motif domain-containing protein 9-like [Xyrauchen texanus]|uniref:sterile alpha motif domain-containing protein 9-like n=1 Tax=Xyrauchen texanus TaxID=154827 RepID=UPI0022420C29|nr:sterile alpha motif domain-containing protein 9-like [Xyrauchen texanus]